MSTLKEIILIVYWLPELVRTMWRFRRGRFFIFRDEPDEFLKLVWSTNPNDEDSDIHDYFVQAMDEIESRKQQGTWSKAT